MDGRERVLRTLEFRGPDKLAVDLWTLPAAWLKHGKKFDEILAAHERDIVSLVAPFDLGFTPAYYERGTFLDPWGSTWTNIQPGVIGEVKVPVFDDYGVFHGYTAPLERFEREWEQNRPNLQRQIDDARSRGKFIIGGWINYFEKLQFLRGTENLYCDIALDEPDMHRLIDMLTNYIHVYLDKWLSMDIDAVAFGDDWGSQRSLLISPDRWRELFKPIYREFADRIKGAGKKLFCHSDGYIMDLYPEFIDLGIDAVNSQLWCMDIEQIASEYAGKITFWGEISRQNTLPHGTPDDIRRATATMKQLLFTNGGGLIGECEIGGDVPLENIIAAVEAWED